LWGTLTLTDPASAKGENHFDMFAHAVKKLLVQ
jgi:hypothetical protein